VPRPPVILYDSDCGLCRWTLGIVLAWDRRRRLEPVALQSDRAQDLLRGMERDEQMASWHLVTSEGQIRSAGQALPYLLALLPGGRPLGTAFRRFPRTTERLYFAVADNRSRLGRLLPRTAVERASARIREREPG
jgi:predicted DCC family thiol-disulfide oxidoreductase YuxK